MKFAWTEWREHAQTDHLCLDGQSVGILEAQLHKVFRDPASLSVRLSPVHALPRSSIHTHSPKIIWGL